MPDAATFTEWCRAVFTIASAASGRGEQCATWLSACLVKGSKPCDFGAVLPQWRSFDAKLATAIRAVLHGDLLVRVNTLLDAAMLNGRLVSGRAMLCAVFRNFKPTGRDFGSDA
eukprot:3229760-Heterocapsa_arctica.AAC.1